MSLNSPSGLGGWLIVAAFGLISQPIIIAISLYTDFLPIITEGYWQLLTTEGSEAFHQAWAPFIIFETVGNIVFLITNIILIYLFFKKSYRFPSLYILFLAAKILFAIGLYYFMNLIPALAYASESMQFSKELSRTVIFSIIWISYFSFSKRVKNTFV